MLSVFRKNGIIGRVNIRFCTILTVLFLVITGFGGMLVFDDEDLIVRATTHYVGGTGGNNYTTIQAAIDAAGTGDTVFVYKGTYNETLVVNKSIHLVGEDTDTTIIDGNSSGDVIYVNASKVLIEGFTITGGRNYSDDAGIKIHGASDCVIRNNNISSNRNYGIFLNFAINITIENNFLASNSIKGINLHQSRNNSILNNALFHNNIELYVSKYNDIVGNDIIGNKSGEFRNGIYLWYVSDYTNVIDNNIWNWSGNGIYIHYSHYLNISDNIIHNNGGEKSQNEAGGINAYYSHWSIISGNLISYNNLFGIYSVYTSYNLIVLNKIHNNSNGILRGYSHYDNGIVYYLNEFKNNTVNADDSTTGINHWNSTKPLSYIYNGKNYTSYLGNYWDDYTGKDADSNGVGDTPYNLTSNKDHFPLMGDIDDYTIIPSWIKVNMNETKSNSTNVSVSLDIRHATLNASVTGDLNGTINFTDLEMVTINSSTFAGYGFFKSNWTANIEGNHLHGIWKGMMYQTSGVRKIHLKGSIFGGLQGLTDGYLLESASGSYKYDLYNSTWTINYFGTKLVFAQLTVNGTVDYQSYKNDTTTIYILQASFSGNATGYYNGSLDVVLTHIRINNASNHYYGEGFSIISYVSAYGSGSGWTYDKMHCQGGITKLTGFFTEPFWSLAFGILDETGPKRALSFTLLRVDLGLPPRVILDMVIWGPSRASPGQTIHYCIEYSNTGLKAANNTEIVISLPFNVTYINNTFGGVYNSTTHEVTWQGDIPANYKNTVSVNVKVKTGLPNGIYLKVTGIIRDTVQNQTLILKIFSTLVTTARDPNIKSGPEGIVKLGEQLDYTIEFENEGQGIAFGVYFIDELSVSLNDSSLVIGPVKNAKTHKIIASAGSYNPYTRVVTWLVGEVGPSDGGYANISINVRDDIPLGSIITNYGVVYFPSVPEITRTNSIVSTVLPNKPPSAFAGSNRVVNTLEEIVFDGSGSTDDDGEIVNYTWTFGDSNTGYGKVTTHSYSDDGKYTVELKVKDDYGESNSHQITVDVKNRAPSALLEADPTEVYTGTDVNFNGLKSSDLDGLVTKYMFDFGDGSNSGWVTTPTTSHQYSKGNTIYTAKLSVKDDDDAVSELASEVQITVNSLGLTAVLTMVPLDAYTYEDILFNAGDSSAPDSEIISYYFDFGDGENSGWITEDSISHKYTDGTNDYTVQLTVKNDDGVTDTAEALITIKNRAPKAVAGTDRVLDTNQVVEFNGGSSTDMDGKIVSYDWVFGDGTKVKGNAKSAEHAYTDDGQYTVTLTVTDDDGESSKDTCMVTVNNVKPTAAFEITPEGGDVTTIFSFSSSSFDTDGTVTEFYWSFGDGGTAEMENPTHQYTHSGSYTISLLVTDDDGTESDVFTKELVLSNLPPVAIASVSTESAEVGEIVTFDAAGSYDLDGEIVEFIWEFGDSSQENGVSVQHSYVKTGTYKVTLTIVDDYGDPASTSLELLVVKGDHDLDTDGDNIPDIIDTDDDNDGLPDLWEQNYNLNQTDPQDANWDLDNDGLTSLAEYRINTDPTNPDTDGDNFNDKIDPYPLDPNLPKTGDGASGDDKDFWAENIYLIAFIIIIITIILIMGIAASLIVKKKNDRLVKPYDSNEVIRQVRDEIIQGKASVPGEPEISDAALWTKLESKRQNNEISQETYELLEQEKQDHEHEAMVNSPGQP